MSIKLIAFDLDGTFLDNQKQCIRENMEAIRAAAERGIHIVPSSGRTYHGIPEEIRNLPFVRYGITINGGAVYDSWDDRTVYQAEIPLAEAEKIFDYMETLPVIFDCYQNNEGWMERKLYDRAAQIVEDPAVLAMVRALRRPVDDFRQFVRDHGTTVQKAQMMFKDLDRRAEELERLPLKFPGYSITSSIYNNIEINAAGANKGAGLKALCEHLGIEVEEAMALGDGTNDIPMLKTAGIGVAMGNAVDEARAAADVVVGTNEEAGVAEAIRRFCLD